MMNKVILTIGFLITIGFGQYYTNQYLLEKDFNDNENFLRPHHLLLKESFDIDLQWMDDDSLSNIFINPAFLRLYNTDKMMLSFDNTMFVKQQYYHYPIYLDYASSYMAPYYHFLDESYYSKPTINLLAIKSINKYPITFGLAYNLNWYCEKKKSIDYFNYYYHPFLENAMINDSYFFSDGKLSLARHQHNLDFITSYELSKKLALGVKASITVANSENKYDYDNQDLNSTTYQEHNINEEGKLRQYEISSSAFYHDDKKSLGLNGGWIYGKQTQTYTYLDTLRNINDMGSNYYQKDTKKFDNDKNWKHSGNSFFINAIGDVKCENMMLLYKVDYLYGFADINNDAIATENRLYATSYDFNYQKSTNSLDYEIKGNGEAEYQKRSAAAAIRFYKEKSYLSIGFVYAFNNDEKSLVESGDRYSSYEFYNEPDQLENFQYETKVVDTKIEYKINRELYKIPATLLLSNANKLRFKATVVKVFGTEKIDDNVYIHYKNFYRHTNYATYDTADDESLEYKDENDLNGTDYNLYVEYDFHENMQLFLSVYSYKNTKLMQTINTYYPDIEKENQITDWKFGIIYNFK